MLDAESMGLLAIIGICLFFSAFFSATETALTSLSPLKTKHIKETKGKRGKILDLWIEKSDQMLSSILIGNNLVNIISSVLAERFFTTVLGENSLAVAVAVMTTLIVIFCEIIPKTMAKRYAENIVIPILMVFRLFFWLLVPFTSLLHFFGNLLSKISSNKNQENSPQITEEELEFLINIGEEEGVIAEQKHDMLSGIFELGDTIVREIMIPRIDMTALSHSAKVSEVVDIFRESGFSRIPIYEERIDNIIGFIHVKDIMLHMASHQQAGGIDWDIPLESLRRDTIFVPESKPVDQLFQELRRQRQHMAIVLDEYGGTSGLVTMEDIFEEIFGEVRDEFDKEEDVIRPTQTPHQYLVECKVHIDDFCDFFDIEVANIVGEAQTFEFDTLGGLILHHFGQIPRIGDKLTIENVVLEVVEISKRRVRRVLAKIVKEEESKS